MNEKPIGTKSRSVLNDEGWTPPRRDPSARSTSSAAEGVRDLSEGVKHSAEGVADQARKAAESQLSTGKDRAIDGLGSVANAIRKTGEHLRAEDQGGYTKYFDQVAQQIDTTAGYLRNRTIPQIARDVEAFARREPALFLGGAFAAGLITGRFLKSSKPGTRSASLSAPSPMRQAKGDGGEPKSTPDSGSGKSSASGSARSFEAK